MIKKKYVRLIYILSALTVSIMMLLVIFFNFKDNIVFFYSPTDLKVKTINNTREFRVGGLVKYGSLLVFDKEYSFVITDHENELTVNYKGNVPKIFREGQGVVAKGKMRNNIFYATEILAKHDEKYMPKEVVTSMKKSGLWRDQS